MKYRPVKQKLKVKVVIVEVVAAAAVGHLSLIVQ